MISTQLLLQPEVVPAFSSVYVFLTKDLLLGWQSVPNQLLPRLPKVTCAQQGQLPSTALSGSALPQGVLGIDSDV